jgi:hypothetical protein
MFIKVKFTFSPFYRNQRRKTASLSSLFSGPSSTLSTEKLPSSTLFCKHINKIPNFTGKNHQPNKIKFQPNEIVTPTSITIVPLERILIQANLSGMFSTIK